MTLKNLEALYKESFATYDLDIFAFSVKDFLISKQDEELSLAVMISKVKKICFLYFKEIIHFLH